MSAGFIEQGQYVNVTGANESNKMVTVNIAQYTAPVEVTPTTGFDGMEKVTIELGPGTPTKYWEGVSWEGFEAFYGNYVWTDGDTVYVSNSRAQYYLDKNTNTWRPKHWNIDGFNGVGIWTDGTDIYLGVAYDQQYVLNKISGEWETKTWGGGGFAPVGESVQRIWTDGTNIYYSSHSTRDDPPYNAIYNKATGIWEAKTWNGLTDISGQDVWTDGDNVYYSSYSQHWVLNKETDTWVQKTWNGMTEWEGRYVWTDGEDIYYSYQDRQYKLDKTTDTWILTDWANKLQISGDCVWTDGENIYFSAMLSIDGNLNKHYVFKNSLIKLQNKIACNDYQVTADAEYNGLNKVTIINNANQWVSKSWSSSSLTSFNGRYVWHDNGNTYYSQATTQKILSSDFTVDQGFYDKTWYGLTDFYGDQVWHDGDNTYYSSGNDKQYMLNRKTSTWVQKTWNGLTDFYGNCIWTDGEDIYYNNYAEGGIAVSYVLNRATDTWEEKTWNINMNNVRAETQIFNCNNNIYLNKMVDNTLVFYMLDKISKEWVEVSIFVVGGNFPGGLRVWSVGGVTYANINTTGGSANVSLRFSPSNNTWYTLSSTDWKGLNYFDAYDIWCSADTGNMYYSHATTHHQLYTPVMKNTGRRRN